MFNRVKIVKWKEKARIEALIGYRNGKAGKMLLSFYQSRPAGEWEHCDVAVVKEIEIK